MPILTGLAGRPASVRTEFYQYVSMPFGLAILLLMAVAPLLRWRRQADASWLHTGAAGGVTGLLALAIGSFVGLRDPFWLAMLAATGWMLGVNAWIAYRLFRRGWSYGAGYLGHAGVAIMTLGIVVSAAFGRTERVPLAQGETREVLGHRVTFVGMTDEGARGTTADLRIERGSWVMDARPRMMQSPRGDGMMHTPAIDLWHDVYVSPVEMGTSAAVAEADAQWLERDEPLTYAGVEYVFRGFRMEHAGGQYMAYADVDVTREGRTTRVSPGLRASSQGTEPVPAEIAGLGALALARMDADHGRIAVLPPGMTQAVPTVVVDMSTKPWVNLVWLGALFMLLGTAIAGVRRAQEQVVREPRRVAARAEGTLAEATPKPV
jgi:cytochrome c biogenesis factor